MKTAISFVIILSVHTATTFPQCKRPKGFTRELRDSHKIFMEILGYEKADPYQFNKAHVVPWKTIGEKISGKTLDIWKTNIEELIEDLHTIDDEWYGNKELRTIPEKRREYELKNDGNKRNCQNYLEKILQIQLMKTINDMTKEMKDLCKCLFSAPANIRPGYRVTNSLVGSYIDPLTTSRPGENKVVMCSDITQNSKTLAKKYDIDFLQLDGGIVTSDQLRNTPKPARKTIQC